ncbi:MAG: hypothetical protein ACRCXT_05870 [Paraclostridium sp.]
MNKVVLSSMIIITLLTIGCTNKDTTNENNIIKLEKVLDYEVDESLTKAMSASEKVKFPIYILDNNSIVKYIELDDKLTISEKINIIADTMSALSFNNLPIEVEVENKEAHVNLIETDEIKNSWEDSFLNKTTKDNTILMIVKNILQEDYEGEWVDSVQISYENQELE